jgi:hypothetical protein
MGLYMCSVKQSGEFMNDRAHCGAEVEVCAHLVQPPDRRYWLDELRLKDFPSLCSLGESSERLQAVIDDLFCTKERKRALAQIVEEHGESDAVKLNLLMVSGFLNHRRSAAVFDVAHECLDEETIAGCTNRRGERDRLALASLMYCRDPRLLVAIGGGYRNRLQKRLLPAGLWTPNPQEASNATSSGSQSGAHVWSTRSRTTRRRHSHGQA